jgi:hypothetical protein
LELLEKLAALVPLPRAHLVCYGGCFAPHSTLRAAVIPTPRQQGVDGEEMRPGTPYWHWASLLDRVFDLAMATCLPPLCGWRELCDLPLCRRGSLRIIAAITHESVMTRILRHRKLASVPPPIAPARCRQEIFAVRRSPRQRGSIGEVCAAAASFALSWLEIPLKSPPLSFSDPAVPMAAAPANPYDAILTQYESI